MILGRKTTSLFRKPFPIFAFLFWAIAGCTLYSFQQNNLKSNHFETIFSPKDQLVMKAVDVASTSTNRFQKVIGEVKAVISNGDTIPATGKLLAYFEDEDSQIQRNHLLLFTPILNKVANRNNPGEFNAERYWKYQNVHYQTFVPDYRFVVLQKEPATLSDVFISCSGFLANIIDRYMDGQEAAVVKGLILGDRSSIESETTRMFGNTGAMHILAVSGMHVAILALILNYILQLFPKYITKKNAVIISLIFVWFYAILTGFSASVARAAWMFTFISGSVILNRNYLPVNGLLFSALIILIISPFSIYDIGFQLSYAAMIGIYAFYPYIKSQLFFKNKWIRTVWEGVALGIAAQLMTTPIALHYFHQFPNYFILTNIALGAYSIVILSLGVGLFIIGWWQFLGKTVGFVLFWVMFSMLWIIQFIDALPHSVSEGFVIAGWLIVVLYILIIVLYWSLEKQKYKYLIGTLAVSIVATSFIVFNRFQNIHTNQFIVFNNNGTVIALKRDKHLVILYDSANVKPKQLQQLMSSYQKIYPTFIKDTIQLTTDKSVNLAYKDVHLKVNPTKGGFEVDLNNQSYFLVTSSRYETTDRKIITAPSIEDNSVFHQLNSGPYLTNIN